MPKYVMSIDTMVEVEGDSDEERHEKARQLFMELLASNLAQIIEVDIDETEDLNFD